MHLTWNAVLPLVQRIWAGGEPTEVVRYVQVLGQVIDGLLQPWTQWREAAFAAAPEGAKPSSDELMDLIRATAADRRQRALDAQPGSLEDLRAATDRARAHPGNPGRQRPPPCHAVAMVRAGPEHRVTVDPRRRQARLRTPLLPVPGGGLPGRPLRSGPRELTKKPSAVGRPQRGACGGYFPARCQFAAW